MFGVSPGLGGDLCKLRFLLGRDVLPFLNNLTP
jgi:hypothetical protein